jgi:predicted tellurium resistance membrane protein TerC
MNCSKSYKSKQKVSSGDRTTLAMLFSSPDFGIHVSLEAASERSCTKGEFTLEELWEVQNLIGLVALTGLEIVLGIDNVVFIAILVAKLPAFQQRTGWRAALTIAMISRILLLLGIGFVMKLKDHALFSVMSHPFTGRDLILLLGGLFLIAKATYEIHDKLEGDPQHTEYGRPSASFRSVMLQVLPLNIVFSLDSVITAVGMTSQVEPTVGLIIMISAIVIASGVMLVFAGAIGSFVEQHPTVKMLGLAFLVLIGVMLVAEGFHREIPKGYVYFAMAFSLFVEMLNIRMRKKSRPVRLHQTYVEEPAVNV